MKIGDYLLAFCITFFAVEVAATPAQVLLIRHGEKPPTGEHLTVKGKERAAALAPYFMETDAWLQYGTAVAIYATKIDADDKSYRTQETITPLSLALKVPIKADYIMTEYALAAHEILNEPKYDGKMVLVCWEHKNIHLFAKALGVTTDTPKWQGDVFDQVWSVSFSPNETPNLAIVQQALMFGDTAP